MANDHAPFTRLLRWEIPQLCRGGSRSLTFSGVWGLPCIVLPCAERAIAVACKTFQGKGQLRARMFLGRLRSGPFEGPAIEKPPALPEDDYWAAPLQFPPQRRLPTRRRLQTGSLGPSHK